ncbi:uncharacterized protein LOC128671242 isoform X2 [Plodia interpunctella]|uniref:uncharacterized protein LOC128671242 isoform X2 n=1 Tax=Plodia interpunctella TaxID=58824 RepID=UPI0023678173|nr:uncharacterized protein LOC128671242 isoform X2 [Plodia interpunctella]
MRSTLAIVLLSTVIQLCQGTVNYCGAKMCGYTNVHTFCQYPAGPSPSCVGYVHAPLTPEEKLRILARLNRRRNDVSAGRLRDYPTAGDMLKLRWVEELAREAQRWADQCRPPQNPDEHDACRDLYSVSVGQCVASVVGEAPGLRPESMVDMWYMQSVHYKGNVSNYLFPMSITNYYGDFAQIVWSYTYMVGCGRSRFMIQLNGRSRTVERLVCNFSPRGPMSGEPIWIQDDPAAICPPRSSPDTEFKALCTYQPYLDVTNNMTTIEDNTLLNTLFEIEMNDILNYPGSLDEIYLTKIAVATLEDKAKTVPYNSFQKRDIISLDTPIVNNELNNNLQESDNAVRVIRIVENTKAILTHTTAKAKLVGRFKSYNPDDLMDVGGAQTTQNYEIPADLPKERDFDADYQYLNSYEETSTASDYKTTEHLNNTSEMTYPVVDNLTFINVTHNFVEDFVMSNLTINESIGDNNNASLVSLKEDELLSDPEIVRDLELALKQMEQSMETSTITTLMTSVEPEKVKRDLGMKSNELMESKPGDSHDIPSYLPDLNMTVDKAPMLNMILKYMPYLKPYKKELIDKVTNRAVIVSPSCFSLMVIIVRLM